MTPYGTIRHQTTPYDTRRQHNKKAQRRVPIYKRANWDQIKDDMQSFEEHFMNGSPSTRSVEDNWTSFKHCLLSSVNKNIPYKTIGKRKVLPWLTRAVKRLISKKHRAYNTAKRLQDNTSWAKFLKLRKTVQKMLHNAHLNYLNNMFDPEDNTSKAFWKYVKTK